VQQASDEIAQGVKQVRREEALKIRGKDQNIHLEKIRTKRGKKVRLQSVGG